MSKQNIFELVRNEDVVLFVGAGFSIYAGYPSTSELTKHILETFDEKDKKLLNSLPLTSLCGRHIETKGSIHPLISILRQKFNIKTKTNKYHKILSSIPHIKTIITTNYDNLFENNYGNRGQKIVTNSDIPYIDNNKTKIFKIHGDLQIPESIIISDAHYRKFLGQEYDKIIWSVLCEKLSTKTILFIGYSLEDYNILYLFEKIQEQLGSNFKPCYFIAPKLDDHKQRELIRRNIFYINSKGEKFIEELLLNIKENIVSDFHNKKIGLDTFNTFMDYNGLDPEISIKNNQPTLSSLKGRGNETLGKIEFEISPNKKSKLLDFLEGKILGDVTIDSDDFKKFSYSIKGINLIRDGELQSITISPKPIKEKIDVLFDSFQVLELPITVYISKHAIEISFKYETSTYKISSQFPVDKNVNFIYEFSGEHGSLNGEIKAFTLIHKITSGEKFKVKLSNGKVSELAFNNLDHYHNDAQRYLTYFECLRQIENHFNIRFEKIGKIMPTDVNTTSMLIELISNGCANLIWDTPLSMTLRNCSEQQIDGFKNIDSSILIQYSKPTILTLHNVQIDLGYKQIEFIDPYVQNLTQLKANQENVLQFLGKTNKIIAMYYKNLSEANPKSFTLDIAPPF